MPLLGPRPPLRRVLTLALVGQLVAVFAAVGVLNQRSGREAVEALSARLAARISGSVATRLDAYTRAPLALLSSTAEAMEGGDLPLDDPDALARAFSRALRHAPELGYVSFGGADGRFVGAQRLDDGALVWRVRDPGEDRPLLSFPDPPVRPPPAPVERRDGYDPRVRPWYTAATRDGGLAWTDPYASATSPGTALITAVRPVRRPGGPLEGVLGVDIILTQASRYLDELCAGQDAQVLVLDRAGRRVAGSGGLSPGGGEADAVQRIIEAAGGPGAITQPTQRHVEAASGGVWVELLPLSVEGGLHWVIVVLVPEGPLLAHYEALNRGTLLASLAALVLALALAAFTSRRLADPLQDLAAYAERVRGGQLDGPAPAPRGVAEIAALTQATAEMVAGLRDRDRLKDAFGRYVTPELAERFSRDPDCLRLGGQLTEVTVLMSDLRGFTGLAARLTPARTLSLLNRYLGAMTEVIHAHQGTIIEFIGDAILVVFGAPFQRPDDARRAVDCALEMQRALARLNEEAGDSMVPWLDMGIGLNAGEVIAGNIGSERATKYGVVGEVVNLTARVESLTLGGEVLLTEAVRQRAGEGFTLEGPAEVDLKGVTGRVRLYTLRGAGARSLPPRRRAPRAEVDLPATVFLLEGRRLVRPGLPARALALGLDDLALRCEEPLELLSKVALRLTLDGPVETGDLYAQVRACSEAPEGGWRAELVFTSVEPADLARIHRQRSG